MKQIRRHKYFIIAIFFLTYTLIQAGPAPSTEVKGANHAPSPDDASHQTVNAAEVKTDETSKKTSESVSADNPETAKPNVPDSTSKDDKTKPKLPDEKDTKPPEAKSSEKEESKSIEPKSPDKNSKPTEVKPPTEKEKPSLDKQNVEEASKQSSPKAPDKEETKPVAEKHPGKEEVSKVEGSTKTEKEKKPVETKGHESKGQEGEGESKGKHSKKEASEGGTGEKEQKGTNKDSKNGKVEEGLGPLEIGIHHPITHMTLHHLSNLNATEKKCTPPAIKQFPRPIMSMETRRHGGLIIHIIVAVYMFIGLAIVCDEYFVASLDRICEELKMSPDVAGATFMAAGSSAPELAIVIIGVFLAKDDIGISGVIGSAVFNIMFVIACCGLCSTAVVYLNWWPLVRDCFFYALSIIVMLIVIYDEKITWVESVVMLITYLIYCVVLRYNTPLERYAYSLKNSAPTEQSSLVSYKTLDDEGQRVPNYGMEWSPEKQQQGIADDSLKNFGMEWSPERHQQSFANQLSGPALNQATTEASPPPAAPSAPPKPSQQEYYKPKAYDPSTQVDPLVKPEGGWYTQATWIILYPIHFFCRKTTPDCRSEKYKNWYPLTFFVSMVWISFYSYFMVWMITIIGFTLGIPDTVMGLTFVAAGVSVPDALSSIAVVKEGYGDMAVSNAVGSNVFDILICLGLPWFLNTAIVKPGSIVKVTSKGLTYSTLSLLSTVVFLLVATHLNGWKLDKRYGFILLVWYLIFITLASLYELNIFADWNPPQCLLSW